MAKFKKLEDAYRFPSFHPLPNIRGVFGDPFARVITLTRREKKRLAAPVAVFTRGITTVKADVFETFPAVAFASTWNLMCVESPAETAIW